MKREKILWVNCLTQKELNNCSSLVITRKYKAMEEDQHKNINMNPHSHNTTIFEEKGQKSCRGE